jgi:hypothetical protein
MRRLLRLLCASLFLVLSFASCGLGGSKLAAIWTDVPEVAIYAELFNRDQDRFRIEVVWKSDLARELKDSKTPPALAIGHFLKSSIVRDRFTSLDYLFGELTVQQAAFYPGLLEFGNIGGQQALLPLSFNLPALIFKKDGDAKPSSAGTIGLDELARMAATFNKKQGTAYVRMGFSPRWAPDFLVLAINTAGASFREGKPLEWSESGLRTAMERLGKWNVAADISPIAADDFQFKYLFTPPYTYITEGRALFAYQNSSELFRVPEGKSALLDYRWFAEGSTIPVLEDLVYAGMPKNGRDEASAEAFLGWLFDPTHQQAMLESSRRTRALESSFGIAGGFSAIREVTEKVFPLYYAALKDHAPPAEKIGAPAVLPVEWPELKSEVIGPWLRETLAREGAAKSGDRPPEYGIELSTRLADYFKSGQNRP